MSVIFFAKELAAVCIIWVSVIARCLQGKSWLYLCKSNMDVHLPVESCGCATPSDLSGPHPDHVLSGTLQWILEQLSNTVQPALEKKGSVHFKSWK